MTPLGVTSVRYFALFINRLLNITHGCHTVQTWQIRNTPQPNEWRMEYPDAHVHEDHGREAGDIQPHEQLCDIRIVSGSDYPDRDPPRRLVVISGVEHVARTLSVIRKEFNEQAGRLKCAIALDMKDLERELVNFFVAHLDLFGERCIKVSRVFSPRRHRAPRLHIEPCTEALESIKRN